jgi:hypothetical protein
LTGRMNCSETKSAASRPSSMDLATSATCDDSNEHIHVWVSPSRLDCTESKIAASWLSSLSTSWLDYTESKFAASWLSSLSTSRLDCTESKIAASWLSSLSCNTSATCVESERTLEWACLDTLRRTA